MPVNVVKGCFFVAGLCKGGDASLTPTSRKTLQMSKPPPSSGSICPVVYWLSIR
jgi:hypothetical protein